MNKNIKIAQLNTTAGAIYNNTNKIKSIIQENDDNVELVVFNECTVSGYPPEDLLFNESFVEDCKDVVYNEILPLTVNKNPFYIIGQPYRDNFGNLYNAAIAIHKGEIKHISFKNKLPNYGVFDEKRYFNSGEPVIFELNDKTKVGILICEDIWIDYKTINKVSNADIIVSLNSSPYDSNKLLERCEIVNKIVKKYKNTFVYANQTGQQDEIVFDGNSFVSFLNDLGQVKFSFLSSFEEDTGVFNTNTINENTTLEHLKFNYCKETMNYKALVSGLKDYVYKNGFTNIVLGLSGGIDSSFVATLAADALGPENVVGVKLPSKFTTDSSNDDAEKLATNLGIKTYTYYVEDIANTIRHKFNDGFLDNNFADENIQSRIRGLLLMAISNANNKCMLLSTGNKSEVSVGYATLYGDMCGGFNPIKDIYKMYVYQLSMFRNNNIKEFMKVKNKNIIPENIINKEPTAELKDGQYDNQILPPYPVLDEILYWLVEKDKSVKSTIEIMVKNDIINHDDAKDVISDVKKKLYISEYKRRQGPPGIKVTRKNLSRDRRYPITNGYRERIE